MKTSSYRPHPAAIATILALSFFAVPNIFAQQQVRSPVEGPEAIERAQHQAKLQLVLNEKASYAASIVRRWENDARASGRWEENYASDLQNALMKLLPENLLAAGEAPSYNEMMTILMTGRSGVSGRTVAPELASQGNLPQALGDAADDLVFTPLNPCRIVDTRNGGGSIPGSGTRTFDMDGSNFSTQGGVSSSCGIPFAVARAVAMTITVTQPASPGYITAWGLGAQPLSSVINYDANQTIANTTVVPVSPGVGSDFSLYSSATTHVVIDVVGYFATPAATALDCTTVSSAVTAVPVNQWTPVDANCPVGRTATGGGYDTTEGTLGYPGVWLTSRPNGNGWRTWVDNQTNGNRSIQTFVNCCRIPGR